MNGNSTSRRGYIQAIAALFVVAASAAPSPLGPRQAGGEFLRAGGVVFSAQVEEPSGGSQPPRWAAAQAATALSVRRWAPQALLAPGLGASIEGINFDTDAANNDSFYSIPPDPHGAAGPDHVVSVVNRSIEWHTKAGTLLTSTALADFFAPLSPLTRLFDPKVIYDQYNGRFVVVALEQTDTDNGDADNTSKILVAVSDDSNPDGTWYARAINSKIDIGGTDSWADYPGLAVDGSAVYITANMFSFGPVKVFQGVRLWILADAPWYSDGALTVTVHDPAVGDAFDLTAQPAHMYGAIPAGLGTFLVQYSGITDGVNEYLGIIRVSNPLTTPTFTYHEVNLGNIENDVVSAFPGAPQPLTTTVIHTGDRRALSAVWRNNALWASASIVPASGGNAGEVTAHWFKINTTNLAAPSLADQGNAGGDDIDPGAFTFYPAVTVDQDGNMALGFALSGPDTFAGAYYAARRAGAAPGTVEATGTLAAGLEVYRRTFGDTRNRWGDYSGISLDPDGEASFWIYNEYAVTNGTEIGDGETGRWGTRWGKFGFKPFGFVSIVSDVPDPSVPGQPVSVTVAVTSTTTTPTGTITVTATSGQGTCSSLLSAGSANCVITPTLGGIHTLTAAYSGDVNFEASVSAPASHSVLTKLYLPLVVR